jgi:flagellar protein FlgJ
MAAPKIGALATDPRALEALKRESRTRPEQAVKAAASQFEQMFVQMLLKSMREATPQFDPLAGSSGQMFQAMLDQQWARSIAEKGIGLAPLVEKQLSRNVKPAARSAEPGVARADAGPAPAAGEAADRAEGFLRRMLKPAQQASRATGLPPAFILGQAALESGWGRHEIRAANGAPTHNVFGIKAGAGWQGASVEALTTEYVNGRPRRSIERFRAYGSYEEAFADYARLLKSSPRYAQALAQGHDTAGFAQAIQRAGYASDPAYADKLARVIQRAMTV